MAWKKWKSYIFPIENDTGLNYGPAGVGVPTLSVSKHRHAKQRFLQNISQNKLVLFQYKKLPPKKKF